MTANARVADAGARAFYWISNPARPHGGASRRAAPATSTKLAATSASQTTTRIRTQHTFAAWNEHEPPARFADTFSAAFALREPLRDVGAFLRWALSEAPQPAATANRQHHFMVSTIEFGRTIALSKEARVAFYCWARKLLVARRARAQPSADGGAQVVLDNPNAGGSSALSEALSLCVASEKAARHRRQTLTRLAVPLRAADAAPRSDVLKTQFGVSLERTEMAIAYWCPTKVRSRSESNRIVDVTATAAKTPRSPTFRSASAP